MTVITNKVKKTNFFSYMKRFFIADQDNYNIYYIQIFLLRFPLFSVL